MFLRNISIWETLSLQKYRRDFPIYGSIIFHCLLKGLVRYKLVEHGSECFYTLFDNFAKLPHLCRNKIYGNLRNSDFINLIIACKSFN